MSNIGELISKKRKESGLTQKQLADILHLSVSAISKWENDVSCPHFSLFHELGNALGLSMEELCEATIGDARYISVNTAGTDSIPELKPEQEDSVNQETPVDVHAGEDLTDNLQDKASVLPPPTKKQKRTASLVISLFALIGIILTIAILFFDFPFPNVKARMSSESTFRIVDEYLSTEKPYFHFENVYYIIVEYSGDLSEETIEECSVYLQEQYSHIFDSAEVIVALFYQNYDPEATEELCDVKIAIRPR